MLGDIQLTEYALRCSSCERDVDLDDQLLVARIQKKLGKRVLTEEEYRKGYSDARRTEDRWTLVKNTIVITFFCAVFVLAFLFFENK